MSNERIDRLKRLAWLLDSSIPIPGTRLSIGLDALIGLVPFVGDLLGMVLSSLILFEALRLGVGKRVLARMALNIAVEGFAGMVPVAGDVFDAAWKANQRNVRLLGEWLDRPAPAERASYACSSSCSSLRAMWHPRIALALAVLAVVLLVASGPGVRAELWPFRFGFGMFAGALICGLAAAGAAVVALVVPRLRAGSLCVLIAALLLGAASAAVPLDYVRRVKTLPYINDITTDTETPPQFLQPRTYEGHFAELQRIGYPELRPLELAAPPGQAFARALEAARAMNLEVVSADERTGRIEAVATTRWFGFKDDVVIRIAPGKGKNAAGSRIDVRSKSRVGRSDVGANAQRIQEFLARMNR